MTTKTCQTGPTESQIWEGYFKTKDPDTINEGIRYYTDLLPRVIEDMNRASDGMITGGGSYGERIGARIRILKKHRARILKKRLAAIAS